MIHLTYVCLSGVPTPLHSALSFFLRVIIPDRCIENLLFLLCVSLLLSYYHHTYNTSDTGSVRFFAHTN